MKSAGPTTDSASLGPASVSVTVPAGAMPTGTTVSIYPVSNPSLVQPLIPSANSYLTSFAVTWENPGGTSFPAITPVSMTITGPNIKAGDWIYELSSTGATPVGRATVDGTVTVTFSSDPLFAISPTYKPQNYLYVTPHTGRLGTSLKLATRGGSGSGAISFRASNGSARGCKVTKGLLTARSAGTCIVTATKAADATYQPNSSLPTTVWLFLPSAPRAVTIRFFGDRSTLGASAQAELRSLAKRLIPGATLTVYGSSNGHATLERRQAAAIANFLKKQVRINVKMKIVKGSSADELTVRTNRQ